MPDPELLNKLHGLHDQLSGMNEELSSAEQIDNETVDALGVLLTDVKDLVQQASQLSDPPEAPENHDVFERVMQFESKHPRVAQFLSGVTEVLNMLGI